MRRLLAKTPLLLSVLGLTLYLGGCDLVKSPCRRLSEQICDCSANTIDRENCLTEVSRRESGVDLTDADNDRCRALIPQCDCNALDETRPGATPESIAAAKRACGLAR